MDALPGVVRRNLADNCAVPPGSPLLVAVSGGSDSVGLLQALALQPARYRAAHVVAHVDHGLRGQDSEADATFVSGLAGGMGLECVITRLDLGNDHGGESLEMRARRRRHAFLAQTARERGLTTVALAHQADDQVELFLLRLLRGSGGSGLAGMRWRAPSPSDSGITLVRPLLAVKREEIRRWLERIRATWREDGSNVDLSIPRNAVRHRLLPFLRDFAGPGVDTVLARVSELTGADADCVGQLAEEWMGSSGRGEFESLHGAIQRAVLRETLIRLGQEPEFELIERLRLKPGARISGLGGRTWIRDEGTAGMRLPEVLLPVPGPDPAVGSVRIQLAGTEGTVPLEDGTLHWSLGKPPRRWRRRVDGVEWLDASCLGRVVELRRWRAGDRYRPLGSTGTVKLQDRFTDARVPRAERGRRWIGTVESGAIFWVEGLPPGDGFRVSTGLKDAIRWQFIRRSNR